MMEDKLFERDLERTKTTLRVCFELTHYQKLALKSLYHLKDTLAVLPTGSGKSLIFQILPWLMQEKMHAEQPLIVLVICPLNSIMMDQVKSLSEKDVPACYVTLGMQVCTSGYELDETDESSESETDADKAECKQSHISSASLSDIKEGKFNIIYMHPETVFMKEISKILRNRQFKNLVCCTVIDEVHMISEWGNEFRPAFSRLGELTCIFSSIPHLALTASATKTGMKLLLETLQFRNTNTIICNPDRPNIFLELKQRLPNSQKYEKYDAIISCITEELIQKRSEFPLTIVYCDNLESLGYCFQYLAYELGEQSYEPIGSHLPEDRIIAQFHKDYTEKMKRVIINELRKPSPKLRLVLATVALGMGLNAPSIQRIVHMRPPTSLEKYLQEIGRAGRNGQYASAVCYFNKHDIASNRKGLESSVRNFVLSESCLRKELVQYFGFKDVVYSGPPHKCCSNCANLARSE